MIRNLKNHNKRKYLSESFMLYSFEVLFMILLVLDTNESVPVMQTISSKRKFFAAREVEILRAYS